MKVLVTGGAGFIGSHLVRALVDRGHEAVVYDDMSTGSLASLPLAGIEVVIGDVRDAGALRDAAAGTAAIVHLAAIASVTDSVERPHHVHDVNVAGTVNVLDVARRQGLHVVLASSAAVYGQPLITPIREESPLAPISPYGASKAAAELYARAYASSYGLPALALRIFNVYGPDQNPAALIPALAAAARAGLPLPFHGDGGQRRDLIYVGDVARVIADSAERRLTADGPVNVGSGYARAVTDLGRRMCQIAGREFVAEYQPARAGDIRDSVADIGALRRLLPDLRFTSLNAGIALTLELSPAEVVQRA